MSTGLAGNLIVGSVLFGPDTVLLLVCVYVCVCHITLGDIQLS